LTVTEGYRSKDGGNEGNQIILPKILTKWCILNLFCLTLTVSTVGVFYFMNF